MKNVLILLALISSAISCRMFHKEVAFENYREEKPKKIVSYQVRNPNGIMGYVDKYHWEKPSGKTSHYYMVYNIEGNTVGHIRADGGTTKYLFNGKKNYLGNFTLSQGLQKIYETSYVKLISPKHDEEYVAWQKGITADELLARREARRQARLKKLAALQNEEEEEEEQKMESETEQ